MGVTYKNCRIKLEDRFKIKELIDKKLKAIDISREMKLNNTTLHSEFKRAGVTIYNLFDYDPIKAQAIWDEHTDFSKRRTRKFSEEEKARIEKMVEEGKSVSWIARELWAGNATIKSYLSGKSMRVPFKGIRTKEMKIRLETLEEQVKIILEMIEDLQGRNV